MARNNRGFAVLESVFAGVVFFTFVATLLVAAYFQFGRAWVQYRTEQALYCLAEGRPQSRCRRELKTKIERFLPWGDWKIRLVRDRGKWLVDIEWKYQKYSLHFKKELSEELITAREASRL